MNKYQEALDNVKAIEVDSEECLYVCDLCEDDIKKLQELVDKETPKKPIHHLNSLYRCENCEEIFQNHHYQNCCHNCGQKLDWSEEVCIEQEKQNIFKEFEKLGYRVCYNKNDINILAIYNDKQESTINVFTDKTYNCSYTDITLKEHQLLHKLFELWGWFDE